MFRPGSQKRTAAPDPRREDHRRDRAHHLPHCLRRLSHILLHPLQSVLLMPRCLRSRNPRLRATRATASLRLPQRSVSFNNLIYRVTGMYEVELSHQHF